MKKAMIFLMVVCTLWSAIGCTAPAEPVRKTFLVENYGLQIVADDTYYEKKRIKNEEWKKKRELVKA